MCCGTPIAPIVLKKGFKKGWTAFLDTCRTDGAKFNFLISFLIFLLLNNKNQTFLSFSDGVFLQLLFNSFKYVFLIVLRVLRTYTQLVFSGLKVIVYGMKGDRLRDER